MTKKYERLVEVFVKAELRDEIKILKKELTYDQFLRKLIKKNRSEVGVPQTDTKSQALPKEKVTS